MHQPNLLPWLPFFAKLARCHVFVCLDDVQFPKNSWVNRVQIAGQGPTTWFTIPVHHHRDSPVGGVRIDYSRPWLRKHLRTLQQRYGRHPYFSRIFPPLENRFLDHPERLIDLTLPLLQWVCQLLEVQPRWVLSSEIPVSGTSSARLIDLCHKVQGSHYLAGFGAALYENEQPYLEASLQYVRQSPGCPTYRQLGQTHPLSGLSVLDALMNLGPQATRELLEECP
ncbi:WbqC family protein [bacterium]|nr:WbqC family protein [bacterium]